MSTSWKYYKKIKNVHEVSLLKQSFSASGAGVFKKTKAPNPCIKKFEILKKFDFSQHRNFLILTWLATFFLRGNSKEVFCEYNKNHGFDSRSCFMDITTRISSIGATISPQEDRKTKSLTFQGNKKIHFLPENIYENFPELVELDAKDCAIKAVSKDNFRNLQTMKSLNLQNNELEKISKNYFEDLVSLEVLDLSENCLNCQNAILILFFSSIKLRKQQNKVHERTSLQRINELEQSGIGF